MGNRPLYLLDAGGFPLYEEALVVGFYEDIAEALDTEGIESRINDGVLFVPIAPELEIQFREIPGVGSTSGINSANVFLASTDVNDPSGEASAPLVGVVFSAEAAVSEVARHIATDQIVTVLRDLLEGTDDRISDLQFEQDPAEPLLVHADVGVDSQIAVLLGYGSGQPEATVTFVTYGEDFGELVDQAVSEIWDDEEELSDYEREIIYRNAVQDAGELTREVLELGTFKDFDQLFNALAVAQEQAREWEELLVPIDDLFDPDFDDEDDDEDDDDPEDDLDDPFER